MCECEGWRVHLLSAEPAVLRSDSTRGAEAGGAGAGLAITLWVGVIRQFLLTFVLFFGGWLICGKFVRLGRVVSNLAVQGFSFQVCTAAPREAQHPLKITCALRESCVSLSFVEVGTGEVGLATEKW